LSGHFILFISYLNHAAFIYQIYI